MCQSLCGIGERPQGEADVYHELILSAAIHRRSRSEAQCGALSGARSGYLLYRYFPNARGSGVPQTKAVLYAREGRITLRTVLGKFFCTAINYKTDFGNQYLMLQRLARTKNANCALLCPLFDVCQRVRIPLSPPSSFFKSKTWAETCVRLCPLSAQHHSDYFAVRLSLCVRHRRAVDVHGRCR